MFELLADPAEPFAKQVPWDKLDLYWVDERCVPPDNAESNYRMTHEALLSKVPLPAERVHRMEGELDPQVAAARYESTIAIRSSLRARRPRPSTWCCWAWEMMAIRLRCFRIPRR